MAKNAHEVRMQILNLVLTYEVTKGHLKWKVSDVSRKLKVSRSLIYYHFGKSKEAILDSCYQLVAEEFYGLKFDMNALRGLEAETWERALLYAQSIYLQNPAIVVFFHRWRLTPSDMQTRALQLERQFQRKLQTVFPELSHDEAMAVHTLIHGVVTSPFAGAEAVKMVVELTRGFLGKKIHAAKR